MGEGDGESHVVATYREIAAHFGLRGPTQGRTKAKRAGWPTEPQNHPADVVRVRVPRTAWERALSHQERALSRRREQGGSSNSEAGLSDGASAPARGAEIPALIKQLEATHATLREQLARAEERAAEAQRENTRLRKLAAAAAAEADARRLEAEQLRGELAAWTAGGPLARALRRLFSRRRRGGGAPPDGRPNSDSSDSPPRNGDAGLSELTDRSQPRRSRGI